MASDTVQSLNENDKTKKNFQRYGTVSGLVTGVGGFLYFAFPMLLDTAFKSQMVLEEGNMLFENWKTVPLAISASVYIFNIENPVEFARGKEKAKLREMGPYVYNQYRTKEIVSWSENKETIKFREIRAFYFDAGRSSGTLNDRVTVINVPIYAMAAVVKGLVDDLPLSFAIAPIAFGFINVFFITHGEGLMKDLTAGQLINGYKFGLLDTIDTLTKPLTWFGVELPDTGMPDNRYGLLSVKNFTKGPLMEVYTGQGSTQDKALKYVSWNEKRLMDFYDDTRCNMMNGTDGTLMGSFLKKTDRLYVFAPDACKSMHATYKELSTVKGIPTWRFILPRSLFAGPNYNPDNQCFCRTKDPEKCDGIFDLGPCLAGAPLAFSFPHFMHASNKIKSSVQGLTEADPKIHESFFDVEPTTGAPLSAAGRLQVNVLMKPIPLVAGFGNVKEAVVPYIWLEEAASIDDTMGLLGLLAFYPIRGIDLGASLATIGGLGLLAATAGYGVVNRKALMSSSSGNEKKQLANDLEKAPQQRLEPPNPPIKQNFVNNNAKISYVPKPPPPESLPPKPREPFIYQIGQRVYPEIPPPPVIRSFLPERNEFSVNFIPDSPPVYTIGDHQYEDNQLQMQQTAAKSRMMTEPAEPQRAEELRVMPEYVEPQRVTKFLVNTEPVESQMNFQPESNETNLVDQNKLSTDTVRQTTSVLIDQSTSPHGSPPRESLAAHNAIPPVETYRSI